MQLSLFNTTNNEQILLDLFQAYYDARKNKRNKINSLEFERHFESRLFQLHEDIFNKTYQPLPSICFIVDQPVKREIFAADFSDRVIHHLLFNYISPVFENHSSTTVTVAEKIREPIMELTELTVLFAHALKTT